MLQIDVHADKDFMKIIKLNASNAMRIVLHVFLHKTAHNAFLRTEISLTFVNAMITLSIITLINPVLHALLFVQLAHHSTTARLVLYQLEMHQHSVAVLEVSIKTQAIKPIVTNVLRTAPAAQITHTV